MSASEGLAALFGNDPAGEVTCSRAGCMDAATARIEWRNPKIHGVDRVKTWLACAAHVEFLREFLQSRSFPVRVVPVDAAVSTEPLS